MFLNEKARLKMFFKVIRLKKGVLKGSLAFMQHFKLVNWWFRFLMSRTGYIL
jgi:hypothetical protein